MKTQDAITILDHFACTLLPVALQMNNGNMKDAVTDSYEVALEVLKQRQNFHTRALHELEAHAGRLDAAEFNDRVVRSSENLRAGEERS
ncbi:MAG: hypothetical protein JO207_03670 [Verrucomicrobia bacterium]|nr:hypothetical protein [Verrucomicrobiota bacterium]MBV8532877.1 hypothetical protein [Verrucomicrobiota bacterium]